MARPRPTKPLLADSLDDVIAAASGILQRPARLGDAKEEPSPDATFSSLGSEPTAREAQPDPAPVARAVEAESSADAPAPLSVVPSVAEPVAVPALSGIFRARKAEPEPEPEPEAEAETDLEVAAAETLRDAVEEPAGPRPDRLAAMRDIARKLRANPSSEETLQFVIDISCECTGASAGMLTVSLTHDIQQVVHGTALGAGPYISVPLRVGGPTFGEIVLTRMSGEPDFDGEDETFADLVAEYVAKAVSALRAGTVLSQDEQDFVDRIVQEFHAPLSSALNLLGLVMGDEGGELAPAKARYAQTVLEDAERMHRLVRDLNVLAHLRPPELRDLQKIAVTPWLREGVERIGARARVRGLTVAFDEPAETHIVQGIPKELDIVIDHLLDNAVKFTEEGGRIEVSVTLQEGQIRVLVSDDGMGFDASDAPRMLDRYARAINAEAARIPGTGLGLYLVKEIVSNHQGRVWLESRRDEGTQAFVQLPCAAS